MEQIYNSCKQGILRDFNEKLFLKGRNVELIAEDDRLEELDNNMKCWWERMTEKGAQRE